MLSYLGTPPGRYPPGRVPPKRVPPRQGTPQAGYPPGRVPPSRVPPGRVPPPLAGPGRVPPPGCPMTFWEMLQSIMGYGYPPGVDKLTKWNYYPPVVLRTRAVITLVFGYSEHLALTNTLSTVGEFHSEHVDCFNYERDVPLNDKYLTRSYLNYHLNW